MRRKWLRALVFVGPLLLWIVLLLVLATTLGEYIATWKLFQRVLSWMTPEFAPIPTDGRFAVVEVSMYQINQGLRRAAHVAMYAGLTLLAVRACQWGEPRLRRRTVLVALLMSLVFTGGESLVRLRSPGRHVRWENLALNLIGTGLVLGGTLVFFGLKAAERRLSDPAAPYEPPPFTPQ